MPTVMLSKNFSLAEMTYSQTAAREGIPNKPDAVALSHLEQLAQVMERVRHACGDFAVTVTSGYRSPEVNAAVGGSETSAHMKGLAADFIIPMHGDPKDVCETLAPHLERLGIDQLILEWNDWVHLGLTEGEPRYQCLTINADGTQTGFI